MQWDALNQKILLGGSGAGGAALTAAPVSTDGSLKLDAASNLYTVKPSEAVNVTLDASGVGSSRFVLAFDFTAGAQTVALPDNFRWNGDAPAMSGKGIYAVDVVYISSGSTAAFTGTYLGLVKNPIDPTKGVVTYKNGALWEDMCADEFPALSVMPGGYDDDWNTIDEDVVVNVLSGGYIGTLKFGCDDNGDLEINVNGGTVSNMRWEGGEQRHSINISSGYVGYVEAQEYTDVRVTGGTVGSLYQYWGNVQISGGYIEHYTVEETDPKLKGGTFGTVQVNDWANPSISDATIGYLELYGWEARTVTLSGSTVGSIANYEEIYGETFVSIDAGTVVGEFIVSLNGDIIWVVPSVGANCRIERLEFSADWADNSEDYRRTITVGANSVVKLGKNAQALIAAGVVVIDADPTAQIINLEE